MTTGVNKSSWHLTIVKRLGFLAVGGLEDRPAMRTFDRFRHRDKIAVFPGLYPVFIAKFLQLFL